MAGAIPLLRPLRESLAGDRITRVMGIVNGTTNFILSAMDDTGASYAETLDEATRLGYAEADPTADVDGYDAASKAAILASLAFHTRVTAADVYREGISAVTPADIAAARTLGRTIKLLAICERVERRERVGGGARAPGDDPAQAPAGERRRRVQRGVRRGRGRGSAHVLRPGRRWRADRERRARRPGRGGPQPGRSAGAGRASRPTPRCPSSRSRR